MDPISLYIELELATLLLAGVGALATWMNDRNKAREHRQREMHHQELKALHQHHHEERMKAMAKASRCKPIPRTKITS